MCLLGGSGVGLEKYYGMVLVVWYGKISGVETMENEACWGVDGRKEEDCTQTLLH